MPGATNQLFLWFLNLFHIPIHTKQRKTEKDNRKGENIIDLCITEPFPKNSRYKEEAIERTVREIKGELRMKKTELIYAIKRGMEDANLN